MSTPAPTASFQFRSAPSNVANFASSQAKALGVVQITLGIFSIIFHIPSIVYHFGMYMIGHGIWCGIFYIIAGGLTLGAAKGKNKCMVIASLTLCILASVAAAIQVVFGVFSGAWFRDDDDQGLSIAGCIAINTIIALFGLIAMIVCIITSAMSCKALCCSRTMPIKAPVRVITLEDGRIVTGVLLPTHQDFTHADEVMLPPAADEAIVTDEKKELI